MAVSRRTVAQFVLLGWAAALAWLARRQFYQGDSAAVAAATRQLEPSAQYFAVRASGRQIGQINITVDTMVDGVRLSETFVLDVPLRDTTRQVARGTELRLTRSLRLVNASVQTFGALGSTRLSATVGLDSILNATALEGEHPVGRVTARVEPRAVVPLMLPYRAAFGGQLEVGAAFEVRLLDLSTGHTTRMPVRVTAESTFIVADSAAFDSVANRWVAATTDTVPAWRLEHPAGSAGVPTVTWVDPGGAVVRVETAHGLTLERSAFEIVRQNYLMLMFEQGRSGHRTVPGMLALAPTRQEPDTAASERWFRILGDTAAGVSGLPAGLAGGRQEVRGDTVRVRRRTPPDSTARRPPELGPTADLPTGEARVRREAVLAVRGARSLEDSLRSLVLRVARAIRVDTSPGAAVAVPTVLAAGAGSPDGCARLLVAMARSLDIPARVAIGVAVLPKGVYAHAWAELWAGRWIAADPTFGHYPASPSLVRFATGGRSHPIDLVPLVGSARFLPVTPSQ